MPNPAQIFRFERTSNTQEVLILFEISSHNLSSILFLEKQEPETPHDRSYLNQRRKSNGFDKNSISLSLDLTHMRPFQSNHYAKQS